MTLVDTNVLLDVLTNDPRWLSWSVSNLRIRANSGPLLINEVIYAEMAGHVSTESELDAAVEELQVRPERTPFETTVVMRHTCAARCRMPDLKDSGSATLFFRLVGLC